MELTLKENYDISLPGFVLHTSGLTVNGNPTFEEWEELGKFLKKTNKCVQFWIGDWLNYGEHTWGEKYSQALEELDYTHGGLKNIAYVSGRIDLSRRRDSLPFSIYQEVASLDPEEQDLVLEKADTEGMNVRETRRFVHDLKRRTLPKPKPILGRYSVVYADPPWRYDFSQSMTREVENKYPTMDLKDIEEMEIKTTENAVLFLWATAPKLQEALAVMNAWGFEYKTHAIWDKVTMGMGYWFRGQHELLLVGTKGSFSPPEESLRVASIIRSERGEHSSKPDLIRDLISKWYPNESKIEIFARSLNEGWHSFGDIRFGVEVE